MNLGAKVTQLDNEKQVTNRHVLKQLMKNVQFIEIN